MQLLTLFGGNEMAIKNYTTKILAERTVGEIETILTKSGANKILKDYDGAGNISAVSFMVSIDNKDIPFKLPIDLPAWTALINKAVEEGKLPKRFMHDADQARRVGWRVIKDWIDAQMALVETKTVKFDQVFLPYVYDFKNDQTLYEKFIENKEKFIALPEGSKNGEND